MDRLLVIPAARTVLASVLLHESKAYGESPDPDLIQKDSELLYKGVPLEIVLMAHHFVILNLVHQFAEAVGQTTEELLRMVINDLARVETEIER